ncbi:MAG: O-antigen ligase family protein [Microgenomates group bacterium]
MVRHKLHLGVFYVTFLAISLVEGIHFILDLRFLYFFIFALPLFLFLFDPKKHYSIPKVFLGLSIVYMGSSFISLINSKQIGVSIELFLRDLSLVLLFLYVFQHAKLIKKQLPRLIVALAVVFVAVSLFCLYTPYGREFIKGVRLNLLFNPAYLHKTIGDYLVFPLLISIYTFFVKRKKIWLVPFILLLPIFLLSFSRTAYITLAVSLLILFYSHRALIKKESLSLVISLGVNGLFILGACMLFVTRVNNETLTLLQNNSSIQGMLHARPLIFSRSPYWIMGIKGFLLEPFVGIGQGNFPYLSYRFTDELFVSTITSFNLIIDMLAEQGIFAAAGLVLLVCYIIVAADKKSLSFLLFSSLCISFLGFSTYTYTQLWMLFFILGGLALASNDKVRVFSMPKKALLIVTSIGVVYIQLLFTHSFLIKSGQYKIAQAIYPFDRENMETLIEKSHKYESRFTIASYINQYQNAFSIDAFRLEYVGDKYTEFGSRYYDKKALQAYEESFLWGGYIYGDSLVDRMEKLYTLKRDLEGQKAADRYATAYLENYERILLKDPKKIQQDTYNAVQKKIKSLQEQSQE